MICDSVIVSGAVMVCNQHYNMKVTVTLVVCDSVIASGAIMICNQHYDMKVAVTSVTCDNVTVSGTAMVCDQRYDMKVAVKSVICDSVIVSGAIVICNQRYDMKVAVQISAVLGRRQRLMMLLLCMLFCNPRRSPKAERKAAHQFSVRYGTSACNVIKTLSR